MDHYWFTPRYVFLIPHTYASFDITLSWHNNPCGIFLYFTDVLATRDIINITKILQGNPHNYPSLIGRYFGRLLPM